jgi:hypothetical protein
MKMKRNKEPTRTTRIFILCATSLFSLYKYREDKSTITHNVTLFRVLGVKIKKCPQHFMYLTLVKKVPVRFKGTTRMCVIR